jgi:hypothetical protein
MQLDPLNTLSWAYQLHYYLCFRTRRRKPFSASLLSVTIDGGAGACGSV